MITLTDEQINEINSALADIDDFLYELTGECPEVEDAANIISRIINGNHE